MAEATAQADIVSYCLYRDCAFAHENYAKPGGSDDADAWVRQFN